ncbi:MAG TPA: redoxin domain-containing protein [Pirellulales bacterium]|jgi:hypothetical protein|nr:redoxin domain-containing protein [Pirellulales bacterium]
MLSAFLSLVAMLPMAADLPDAATAGMQLTYRGTVAEMRRDRPPAQPAKSFDLTLLVAETGEAGSQLDWLVDERGAGGWPWLERFGRLALDAKSRPVGPLGPALLYDYGAGKSVIGLLPPLFEAPQTLEIGATWEQDGLKYEVESARKLGEYDCWQISAENNFGPKRTLWVGKGSPVVAGYDERVFMDRGSEYQLSVRLIGTEQLSDVEFQNTKRGYHALLALRARLKRAPRSQVEEIAADQRDVVNEQLTQLEQQLTRGALAKLVRGAMHDMQQQSGRADALANLTEQHLGKPVEKFSISGLNDDRLTEGELADKVTVLHFWDYRDEPLKEPYGQVGYLEFLHNRRKGDGVKVFGVAVDGRLNNDQTRKAATASVRKLRNFMNLTYPVLLDDGTLLKQFGDPRVAGANLPLFVVIGPDGTVVHHHVGYYAVDRQDGLKELDAVVAELLKPAEAEADKSEK